MNNLLLDGAQAVHHEVEQPLGLSRTPSRRSSDPADRAVHVVRVDVGADGARLVAGLEQQGDRGEDLRAGLRVGLAAVALTARSTSIIPRLAATYSTYRSSQAASATSGGCAASSSSAASQSRATSWR